MVMTGLVEHPSSLDIRDARILYPATETQAYFNTSAVGLASRRMAASYHSFIADWTLEGLDWVRGDMAANAARTVVAGLMGAEPTDVALIASVSAAAGFVASQFGAAESGQSIVVGEREYSSNYFPWRLLARKGYDVRLAPFRNGGVDPEDIALHVDGGTQLVAVSAVQTASGHRSDLAAISGLTRAVGAVLFVDGTQCVGAMPMAAQLPLVDVLVAPDHKYLMNAGRGVGYCYLSPEMQARFTPTNAGWRAGADPYASFFGPTMELSETASRFDSSISWLAAIGDDAAVSVFADFGTDVIFARNAELADTLRGALTEIGWAPLDLPVANQSTIVSVALGDHDAGRLIGELESRGIACSARNSNLRMAVHFYNHEDDIRRLTTALRSPSG